MLKETKYLIGACILSAAGYLIPLYFGFAWLGLFILLLIGASFLGILSRFMSMYAESVWLKRGFSVFALLIVVFHAIAFAHDYGRKDFQKEILLEIRQTIEEGITKAQVQKAMVYVLGQFHEQEDETLVETAKKILAENMMENGRYDEDPENEAPDDATAYYYITDEEADELTIKGVSRVVPGSDADYINYDGSTGMMELDVVLTREGVSYEVVN